MSWAQPAGSAPSPRKMPSRPGSSRAAAWGPARNRPPGSVHATDIGAHHTPGLHFYRAVVKYPPAHLWTQRRGGMGEPEGGPPRPDHITAKRHRSLSQCGGCRVMWGRGGGCTVTAGFELSHCMNGRPEAPAPAGALGLPCPPLPPPKARLLSTRLHLQGAPGPRRCRAAT